MTEREPLVWYENKNFDYFSSYTIDAAWNKHYFNNLKYITLLNTKEEPMIDNLAMDMLVQKENLQAYKCKYATGSQTWTFVGVKGYEKDDFVWTKGASGRKFPDVVQIVEETVLDLSINAKYRFIEGKLGSESALTSLQSKYDDYVKYFKDQEILSNRGKAYSTLGINLEKAEKDLK